MGWKMLSLGYLILCVVDQEYPLSSTKDNKVKLVCFMVTTQRRSPSLSCVMCTPQVMNDLPIQNNEGGGGLKYNNININK